MSASISMERRAEVLRMRREGATYAAISRATGVSTSHVARLAGDVSSGSDTTRTSKADYTNHRSVADARRLLRQVPPDTRGLTAYLCGDPLSGRSALDKEKAGSNA